MRPALYPYLEHSGFLAIAHRGGALEAPENTMAAFGHAVALGYSYVETDVHATRDGVLLAFHDDKLDRVTDSKGIISQLDYSEVREAKIAGEHAIPLLEDVLGAWPTLKVNIDPKDDHAVSPLIATIKRTESLNRVCVGAFSDERLKRVRAAFDGRLCTSMGPSEVRRLYFSKFFLPVGHFDAACAQIPERHGDRYALVDRWSVWSAHRKKLQVHVWTISEQADIERLIDLGVDGLVTDRPTLLRDILIKRGLWG